MVELARAKTERVSREQTDLQTVFRAMGKQLGASAFAI